MVNQKLTGKVYEVKSTQNGAFVKIMLAPSKNQEGKYTSAFISVYVSSKSLEICKAQKGDILELEVLIKYEKYQDNYNTSFIAQRIYNWGNVSKEEKTSHISELNDNGGGGFGW
jgi:hypothetical protein